MGETLEVEMSGEAAILIREDALSDETDLTGNSSAKHSQGARTVLPDVHKAIEQLYGPAAASLSVSEAHVAIDVVVNVLQGAGRGYILPQIATDLSNKGLLTLASALAAKLDQSGGEHKPPLRST